LTVKKILIIEDDQIVARIYRNKFLVEGYNVEIALDGETGFELVKSFRPDAILLDLVLPKLSGVELTKKIRAEPEFGKVPVIVFSNTYLTNTVKEAWKAGATKCLSKANCTPKQVIDMVRGCIGNNGAPVAAPPSTAAALPPAQPALAVSRPSAAPQPPEPAAASDADAEFQAELRKSFVDGLPSTLAVLRGLIQGLIKAGSETVRLKQVHELYRPIHALTGNAGIVGLHQIAQTADALEALLKELYEKPGNINASTLRTVASAIDLLAFLFEHGTSPGRQQTPPAHILVVDDEVISRRAITYALEKAKLKSVSVEDPNAAFEMLSQRPFDLVFLDVDMPGMSGFELCAKLRGLPAHKKTPVVFVTSLNDFESRANSTVSGGNDFIAKPFMFIELAVKALVHVMRGRAGPAR
jgi:DNA-binding response OmpR family regulator